MIMVHSVFILVLRSYLEAIRPQPIFGTVMENAPSAAHVEAWRDGDSGLTEDPCEDSPATCGDEESAQRQALLLMNEHANVRYCCCCSAHFVVFVVTRCRFVRFHVLHDSSIASIQFESFHSPPPTDRLLRRPAAAVQLGGCGLHAVPALRGPG